MSQLRTRHPSTPERNGRGEVRLDIRSDNTDGSDSVKYNNAKYGKKRRFRKNKPIPLHVVFIALCIVYLLAVITWSASKGGQQTESFAAKSSLRQFYHNAIQQFRHVLGQQTYVSTPQTVNLDDLCKGIGSKNEYILTHRKYYNISADYGGIEYTQIQSTFRREINYPSSAAFDSEAAGPESTNALLELLPKKVQNVQYNYPHYVTSEGEMMPKKQELTDATAKQLKQFYDDDNVYVFPRANDGKTFEPRACRGAEFEKFYFPTCNNFHEFDLGRPYDEPEILNPRPENQLANVRYLDHGYYRDVWVVEDNPWIWPTQYKQEKDNKPKQTLGVIDEKGTADLIPKAYRTMVLKTLRYKHKPNFESFEEIQLEAIIMERMTKSNRIMDIYGHCGFSVTAELVPIEFEERVVPGEGYEEAADVEERNKDGLRPYNNFTAEEKLDFALQMAESIADLHGFQDGVIVHDDVQLCQWMTKGDGKLKLGDFNRATIMQWDEIKGEYCKFGNGEAFGNYRAPEEFVPSTLNEQIDTFSFCNNIYGLLVGLWNFYDTDDDDAVHVKLIGKKLPYVDPRWKDRSYEESKLVELLPKCWAYDPDERISIFDAVKFLRQAIADKPRIHDR